MIKGIGVDVVEISRMERALTIPGFIKSTFSEREINNAHGNRAEYYATRFACKEALFKAIHKRMDWRLIETLNHEDGKPYILMEGDDIIHISISTEAGLAVAYCIVERYN